MDFWTAAVIIVALVVTASTADTWLRRKGKLPKDLVNRVDALEENTDYSDLESRIEALEAIVTDDKRNLNQEINQL